MKKHIIWSDMNLSLEDWRTDLQEQYPGKDDDFLVQMMYETNRDYLDDERMNLNIQMPTEIIAIADLGLWNGRHSAYKIIESGNIKDCLYPSRDDISNEWFIDKHGNLRGIAVHHDGHNNILFRAFNENLSEEQKQNFLAKVLIGSFTPSDISRYTQRLGDEIGKVYGWSIPQKNTRTRKMREPEYLER